MITRSNYHEETKPDFSQRYWYGKISQYYPCGFLEDINASCDTLEELKSLKSNEDYGFEWEVFWDNREFKEISL